MQLVSVSGWTEARGNPNGAYMGSGRVEMP